MRAVSLLLALALTTCGGPDTLIPEGTDPVPFTSLNSLFSGHRIESRWVEGRTRRVLRDQAAWADVHQRVTGQGPAPAIDFGNQAVIFAAMGSRLSTGFDIVIDEIRKDAGGRLYVRVHEVVPGPGCGTQAVPTSPVTAVLTIADFTSVLYVESTRLDSCAIGSPRAP